MAETAGSSSASSTPAPGLDSRIGRFVEERAGGSWPRRELVVVVGITLVAAALRFHGIEVWSVSAAEALTWRHATAVDLESWRLPDGVLRVLLQGGLLPAHGEGWLRLPFLFVATLAVPLLALVGEVVVPRRVALLAAGLLAVHPWHVEVCQLATGHGVALTVGLFALVTAAAVRRRLENDGDDEPASLAIRVGVGSLFVVAGCCHPIGWFAGLAVIACRQFEALRSAERRDRPRRYLALVVLALATVVVAFILRPVGEGAAPLSVPGTWLLQGAAIGLPVLLLAVIVPWLAVGDGQSTMSLRSRRELGLAALVVGPGPSLFGLLVVTPAREHALLVLPCVLVLAAAVVLELFDRLRDALAGDVDAAADVTVAPASRWPRRATLLLAVLPALVLVLDLLIGTFLYTTARRGSRPDWRGVRDVVVAHVHKRRLDVIAGAGHDSMLYYLRPHHWREATIDPHPEVQVVRIPATTAELTGLLQDLSPAGAMLDVPDRPTDSDLFVIALSAERAELRADAETRVLLESAFELFAVLPCAGTQRDEAVYVYRWVGAR